ncbi:hypothetical protein PPYR_00483 [Photinus pyralis]|uniref:Guanine deaminase n=1 Tax=Photinus pyralis TaxID=7054 RepID=A0A1Y1NHA4_PHOPY|nr:guanine deaminase-like [Photinus pyralis]XP_031329626.1 guanine deaminase-like [Photinus pyralis]KAB0803513.1 hypothetical protein PPYR_00483 [Photinus pyralis]
MESIVDLFIGNIIHCDQPFTVTVIQKGFVAVQRNKIIAVGHSSELQNRFTSENVRKTLLSDSQILIPGLIDTHIHACQYPNIGVGMNKPLLQWLKDHTYPLEKKFKDAQFSKRCYDAVVKKTLSYGTTTAAYFGSIYTDSTLILADSAIRLGQRALVGKVNLTKNGPADYIETSEESLRETRRFINEMSKKNSELVKPIITPRFAVSVTKEDLKALGEMAKEFNLPIQTHLCENLDEIELVKLEFHKDYPLVYDEAALLTDKTILAHCVYVKDVDVKLLRDRGSAVAHCPNSNLNIRSGICDVKAIINGGVKVGLGTDVAGGCSCSVINAMRYAITSSAVLSFTNKNYEPVNYCDAFYLATLGGAKALALSDKIGSFHVDKDFDALIVDMDPNEGPADYLQECAPLELLQKFVYVGDDRNVISVYVAGKKVK